VVNADAMATRLAATFDTDVHVRSLVTTETPSGDRTVSHGAVERTLRGRVRLYDPTLDADIAAGKQGAGTVYVVTLPRFSNVLHGQRLNVDGPFLTAKLEVVGARGAKSTYIADYVACVRVS
jgi:hypothetical protein